MIFLEEEGGASEYEDRIHAVEFSALKEAQAEIARLKTAYEDLKNTDWNKHDTANAELRAEIEQWKSVAAKADELLQNDNHPYELKLKLWRKFKNQIARAALGEKI